MSLALIDITKSTPHEKYLCLKKINLFFDRPILFSYGDTFINSFPGVGKFYCDMTVESKSKETGIIATVQLYRLRMTNPTTCYDWIKYDRDTTARCGDSRYGIDHFPGGNFPSYRVDSMYSGPFLLGTTLTDSATMVSKGNVVQPDRKLITYFNIEPRALQPGEELKVVLAYTGFRECNADNVPSGWFNCGYGVCIMSKLLYDGVVNCPFGDCIDEGSCEEAMKKYPQVTRVFHDRRMVNGATTEITTRRPPPNDTAYNDQSNARLTSLIDVGMSCRASEVELKNIRNEFEKHNTIFQELSSNLEKVVKMNGRRVNN